MFEKISPQKIKKTVRLHHSECWRRECTCSEKKYEQINFLPEKLNLKPIKGKKFHVLINHEGKKFFSYHLNQMLEEFNYSLAAFEDVKIFHSENGSLLEFKTMYGFYRINELLIIE